MPKCRRKESFIEERSNAGCVYLLSGLFGHAMEVVKLATHGATGCACIYAIAERIENKRKEILTAPRRPRSHLTLEQF